MKRTYLSRGERKRQKWNIRRFRSHWVRTGHFSLLIPGYKERSPRARYTSPLRGRGISELKRCPRQRERGSLHLSSDVDYCAQMSYLTCMPARRDASLCAANKSGEVNKLRSLKTRRGFSRACAREDFLLYFLSRVPQRFPYVRGER